MPGTRRLIQREQQIKLSRLMNMRYRPAELAEELGVNVDTVYRSWIPAGAPCVRDNTRSYWIVGTEFAQWAQQEYERNQANKTGLAENEAWCMHCCRPAQIIDLSIRRINRHLAMKQGLCAFCGGKVNKAISVKALEGGK